jgi:hypothetical protein
MKHAGDAALDLLENLLSRIRKQEGLKERKRGVFYRGSAAFLHFHEDPTGLFADLRLEADWERMPVNTAAERRWLLEHFPFLRSHVSQCMEAFSTSMASRAPATNNGEMLLARIKTALRLTR